MKNLKSFKMLKNAIGDLTPLKKLWSLKYYIISYQECTFWDDMRQVWDNDLILFKNRDQSINSGGSKLVEQW